MDHVTNFAGVIQQVGPPFIFVLGLVVFVHEAGHFLVARLCGVKVEAFSIGFGPAIVSWKDKTGTVWKLSWLPLGGYVKFVGDEGPASNPDAATRAQLTADQNAEEKEATKGLFHFKPLSQRAAVVAAGPLSNFIFAILVFTAMFILIGEQRLPARVASVVANMPAASAGFMAGDLVKEIDGRTIETFSQMQEIVGASPGQTLTIEVERKGVPVTLTAVPAQIEAKDSFDNVYKIGQLGLRPAANPADIAYVRYDPLTAFVRGVDRTAFIVERTLFFVRDLALGRQDASQLSGPIGIAQYAGVAAQQGFSTLITLAALLSISVGLLNLFPIPLLDGGHLLYYAYEAIRGRPLGARAQELGYRIGLAFVISVMVFATWNDLIRNKVFGG